jgi:hypothetical protein
MRRRNKKTKKSPYLEPTCVFMPNTTRAEFFAHTHHIRADSGTWQDPFPGRLLSLYQRLKK